ncbi:multicopper oxidase family protein [Hymenobacter defluvii]|uniref:Multicopper oxidase domain-containing protein n=1 Tax=Hymenobacter defluvii TaxID=2054411 RepID=A0ABS3TGA1_9BACT|nr:multicopper oxidase family protein [Hymenobacter defluvii]MBO3272218.1 multicopper oxidase domain-containing protein [Hymenobacter defluvii]
MPVSTPHHYLRQLGLLLALVLSAALTAPAQQAAPAAYAPLYSDPAGAAARPDRHLVRYTLRVSDTTLTIGGVRNRALVTNGQLPAPTLTFTEGDTALIFVHNATHKSISFHWHGMLLPNKYDGVPLLTTMPIEPGQTLQYKFPLVQHGTLWYHSHTRLNEQLGQYGALVVYPPRPLPTPDQVVLLSDWTRERPWEVLRSLKRETDWYAIKRGSVQSYGGAVAQGFLGTKLRQEWKRMPEMDLADVYYQHDLVNGQPSQQLSTARPGQPVRLRVINGSSASYFWVQFGGGKLRVVAADGVDVQPVEVDKLLIGTAETYDVEVTPPAAGQYELRDTSWDMAQHTSLWLGTGEQHPAPTLPRINYYQLVQEMNNMMRQMPGMKMGRAPAGIPAPAVVSAGQAPPPPGPGMHMNQGQKNNMDMGGMGKPGGMDMGSPPQPMAGMNRNDKKGSMKAAPLGTFVTGHRQLQAAYPQETLLDYTMLKAPQPTTIPADRPVRTIHLYLTGNMFRYVWSLNNVVLSNADKIAIKRGETVRFVLHNTTMMSHPMHLHGHYFRVVNGQGDYSPLKNTLSVAPMDLVTLEFEANEYKDWFFHCHLLYHLDSGMARIVHYAGDSVRTDNPKLLARFVWQDRKLFPFAEASGQSQGTFLQGGVRNSYWLLRQEARFDWHGDYESETHLQRYLGPKQFVAVYAGADFRDNSPYLAPDVQKRDEQGRLQNSKDFRRVACVGVRYFLPLLVWSDLRLDTGGKLRLQLERQGLPLTRRLRTDLMVNSDREYTIIPYYILGKYVALAGSYDSDYGWGAGLRIIY